MPPSPLEAPSGVDEFSLAEARQIIKDLFTPNPVIYWADFLLSILVGNVCFAMVRLAPFLLPEPFWLRLALQAFSFVGCCLLFYRAAMFIHELVHLRSGAFGAFRVVWNLLCGIPFLIPSFVYYCHTDHHRRKHFGTSRDGEYLPLGRRPPSHIVWYLAQSFLIPILAVIRFLLLTPLTWFSPRLRRWIHQRASSLVIDPSYVRPLPTKETLRIIRLQELACFLWCLGIAVGPPIFLGRFPIPFLIQAYLIGVCIILLNAVRTLGAHRWTNDGEEMTFVGQMLDSVTVHKRPLISELWGPVGLRYHALHHLFPSLPYHAMPQAHRRLMEQLPLDSPYRKTEQKSLTSVLGDLWRRAVQSTQRSNPTIKRLANRLESGRA